MPDIVNRASILAFSGWIPADDRREHGREGGGDERELNIRNSSGIVRYSQFCFVQIIQIRSIMQLQSQAHPIRRADFLIVQFIILLTVNKISETR